MAQQSAAQTIGPYFAYCLTPEPYGQKGITSNRSCGPDTSGEHIVIRGRVLDGEGAPVGDALVESWQANSVGRYRHPEDDRADLPLDDGFTGFGRCMTDDDGVFIFETIKPGRVPGQGNQVQAPHISLIIQARGMLSHAFTRLYFSDESDANSEDAVLSSVEQSRRGTLIASLEETSGGPVYRLDICLQGDHETVFFDA